MEMEGEQEDVRKITEFINNQKSTYQNNFQLEFQDFVCFKLDFSDHEIDNEAVNGEEEIIDVVEVDDVKNFSAVEPPTQVSVTILTNEERSVIESCTDAELKRLLLLNRYKNMQLIKLHKKIKDLLIECEDAMEEKQMILKNLEAKQMNQQAFIWKLAAPYFKDKKFFACPLNQDTIWKRRNNELSIYDLTPSPKWTPIEFDRLINAVKYNYNTNRQNDLVRKINALKANLCDEEIDDKNRIAEILNLEEHLEKVKNDTKIPPLNSNDFVNWYKVAETFLKDKHTASECQSVWHMIVHPDINKSEWTNEENKNLTLIAKHHLYQNWDLIAAKLNTKRTGFTTCLHYFSKLCDKFKKNKFSPEEDTFLLEVVDGYKMGSFIPWNKVVCHFNNRSRHQLYHRYTYFLSQNHVKKGKFTEAEDILLMILVNTFGRNFKKCAEYMPHRSQVQLKSRYYSNLQRHIKKGTFTEEDDQIIFDYVQKHGEKNWSGLTEKLNRCNAQIRQRYKLIKSFLLANPNAPLSDIPKRKHRFDKIYEDQYSFLKYMADEYKNVDYIPTISMIEESLQVEMRTPTPAKLSHKNKKIASDFNKKKVNVKNIDTMLIDFFSSSMKLKQHENISEINIVEASNNVEEVLSLLGANLNIPKDFECNSHLDNIDVEILGRISKKISSHNKFQVDRLISPNISTLVGLRSLIIKHKNYKTQQKSKNLPSTSKTDKLIWPIEQNLLKLEEKTREQILFHRNMFSQRFSALFSWSALLSLEKPDQIIIPEGSSSNQMSTMPARTYIRKSVEQLGSPVVKKRKIDVSTLTNLSQQSGINSQLKFVHKSVVEKLMQNKNNISILRVETITGPDGIIRPVLQSSNSVISKTGTSSRIRNNEINSDNEFSNIEDIIIEDDVIEDVEDNERDLEDVQKLNVILKSEVLNEPVSYSSEEYKTVKGDVRLLKEILHYENIKVKPDPDNF